LKTSCLFLIALRVKRYYGGKEMGRRRYRRSYTRPARNRDYVWQRVQIPYKYETNVGNNYVSYLLEQVSPGVVDINDTTNAITVDHFDYPIVLERTRGQLFHGAKGADSTVYGNGIFPVAVAAFVVPVEIGRALTDADMPNLFATEQGDNYPIFFSHLCDAGTDEESVPPFHEVDVKAKRTIDVGGSLVISTTAKVPSAFGGNVDLTFGGNLSFLWRRKA